MAKYVVNKQSSRNYIGNKTWVTVKQETVANHLLGWFNDGGLAFCILIRTLIGCISWFGGSIWANSISVIPMQTTQPLTSHLVLLLCHQQYRDENNTTPKKKNHPTLLILCYTNTCQQVWYLKWFRKSIFTEWLTPNHSESSNTKNLRIPQN